MPGSRISLRTDREQMEGGGAAAAPTERTEFKPPKARDSTSNPQKDLKTLEGALGGFAKPKGPDDSPPKARRFSFAPRPRSMTTLLTQEERGTIVACFDKIKQALDHEVDVADAEQLRQVQQTQGKLWADIYHSTHAIVKLEPDYTALLAAAKQAEEDKPSEDEGGRRTCKQKTLDLGILLEHARATLLAFQRLTAGIVETFAKVTTKKADGGAAVTLHDSPLKHLYRCMEKACFKVGENRYHAETVCDIVRCIVECANCTLMAEVLQAILVCEGVRVVRVKDRANNPTSMNWMDIMLNITMADDVNDHICEIQIVHHKMLVQRTELDGHETYAQLRAATEILEVQTWVQSGAGRKGTSSTNDGPALIALKQQLAAAVEEGTPSAFVACADIQGRIMQIKAQQAKRELLKGQLSDSQTKENYGECDRLHKIIKSLEAGAAVHDAQAVAVTAVTAIDEARWHRDCTACELLCKRDFTTGKGFNASEGKPTKHFCHVCGKAVCNTCAPKEQKCMLRGTDGTEKMHRICPLCIVAKEAAEKELARAEEELARAEAMDKAVTSLDAQLEELKKRADEAEERARVSSVAKRDLSGRVDEAEERARLSSVAKEDLRTEKGVLSGKVAAAEESARETKAAAMIRSGFLKASNASLRRELASAQDLLRRSDQDHVNEAKARQGGTRQTPTATKEGRASIVAMTSIKKEGALLKRGGFRMLPSERYAFLLLQRPKML
jgi:hypothetical protein